MSENESRVQKTAQHVSKLRTKRDHLCISLDPPRHIQKLPVKMGNGGLGRSLHQGSGADPWCDYFCIPDRQFGLHRNVLKMPATPTDTCGGCISFIVPLYSPRSSVNAQLCRVIKDRNSPRYQVWRHPVIRHVWRLTASEFSWYRPSSIRRFNRNALHKCILTLTVTSDNSPINSLAQSKGKDPKHCN